MKAEKAASRALAQKIRAQAHALGQGAAAQHLAAYLAQHAMRPVAGYLPMRSEIDPLPALAGYAGPVGMPVIPGKDQPLRFRSWHVDAPLIEGSFKALIPAEGDWMEPEILVVPLLAFDARGYRLGYGGGFYDRTLALLRQKKPVIAVGYAFAAQEVPEVPTEATDERLDAMITEQGLRLFG